MVVVLDYNSNNNIASLTVTPIFNQQGWQAMISSTSATTITAGAYLACEQKAGMDGNVVTLAT